MLQALLVNLTDIGWAMLIFLCAYLANVAFSLFYNIKLLSQPFDWGKLAASGLKILTVLVGVTLLCTAITALPLFAAQVGWAIPAEYTDVFTDIVIIAAVLLIACKYIVEAFNKFKAILEWENLPLLELDTEQRDSIRRLMANKNEVKHE